ncbi:MAG: hypothetical protein JETCAE03_36110 [Ignavibacteriaceae bacterium]|jgi:F0F1-type ATP synthase gamma subunit|nr:MAG: hypothetical protein JETCAE03_36110 [Ignavibacteriaceae bacterium]
MREEYKRKVEISGKKFKEFFTKHGYNLIGFCEFCFENTFIFETAEEAAKAHQEFEKKNNTLVGWWYGKEDFQRSLDHFQQNYWEIPVIWFNEKPQVDMK